MRTIKFRAWDKDRKKYFQLQYCIGFDISDFETPKEDFQNLIIEQFTGLKDKNGKEIYEGDIVDLPITDTCSGGCCEWVKGKNGNSGHSRSIVEFKYGCFYINKHGNNSDVEIIGNIHENKELIN